MGVSSFQFSTVGSVIPKVNSWKAKSAHAHHVMRQREEYGCRAGTSTCCAHEALWFAQSNSQSPCIAIGQRSGHWWWNISSRCFGPFVPSAFHLTFFTTASRGLMPGQVSFLENWSTARFPCTMLSRVMPRLPIAYCMLTIMPNVSVSIRSRPVLPPFRCRSATEQHRMDSNSSICADDKRDNVHA